jgi:NAD(P)H-hydrate epimerase
MSVAQQEVMYLDWSKYSSVGLGPGLGTGENGAFMVKEVLSGFHKPIVIDADALNIISERHSLLSGIPANSILTPHPKEFERLFEKTSNNYERLRLAMQQAQDLGVYIIIKGRYSTLACPDGDIYFNSTGNPGMATGGSGDVLTGILAGLLSQGYTSKHAAIIGMYIHGMAGDLAAAAWSEEALCAGDIVEYLGKAWLSVRA